MVEPQYPVVLFAPNGAARDDVLALQEKLRARGAETYVVADATTGVAEPPASSPSRGRCRRRCPRWPP